MFDPQAARARCEAATDVLDDAAFDAHLGTCRQFKRGSGQEFGCCEYQPCAQRRFALAVLNADLPAALEALEEAQERERAVRQIALEMGASSLGLLQVFRDRLYDVVGES